MKTMNTKKGMIKAGINIGKLYEIGITVWNRCKMEWI